MFGGRKTVDFSERSSVESPKIILFASHIGFHYKSFWAFLVFLAATWVTLCTNMITTRAPCMAWLFLFICFRSVNLQTTSQARVFTYARRCDKDPGSGWSRDTPKSGILLISDLYFIGEGW